MTNIVEFKDVSMSFGNNKVLKNIDLIKFADKI